MEKYSIYRHRASRKDNPKDPIDFEFIGKLLQDKGLVKKKSGLCSTPYTMYFSQSYTDNRGISYTDGTVNTIHVTLHENPTHKKNVYFHSIKFYLNDGFYYLECFIQRSSRIITIGPQEHICYKILSDQLHTELPIVLEDIFLHV